MTLNYGTIEVNDSWQLAPMEVFFEVDLEATINTFPTDVCIGFSFGTTGRTLKLSDVKFKSLSDVQTFLGNIQTLHEAGSPYKVEWQVEATPTYFKFDGTTAYMTCFCTKIKGLSQKGAGYQSVFTIAQIVFVEASKS